MRSKKLLIMLQQRNFGFMSDLPVVTKNIIIINILVWLATLALPRIGIDLVDLLGLHVIGASSFHLHQLLTYMFMHDPHSFTHVFFNMFAVFMFGRILENLWGPKRFLLYYIITGLGAAITQELVWIYNLQDIFMSNYQQVNLGGGQLMPVQQYLNLYVTIGASGSVFGILLAFGMLFPNIPLYIMFIPIPIKAKYFVIFYGLAELFMGVANFGGDNVAHFAHLGGMLFGFIMIYMWKKKNKTNGTFYF